jgi:hypothetical protein
MAAPKSAQRRLIFIVSRQRIDLYDALRNALSAASIQPRWRNRPGD